MTVWMPQRHVRQVALEIAAASTPADTSPYEPIIIDSKGQLNVLLHGITNSLHTQVFPKATPTWYAICLPDLRSQPSSIRLNRTTPSGSGVTTTALQSCFNNVGVEHGPWYVEHAVQFLQEMRVEDCMDQGPNQDIPGAPLLDIWELRVCLAFFT